MPTSAPRYVLIAQADLALADRVEASLRMAWPDASFRRVATTRDAIEVVGSDRVSLLILRDRPSNRSGHVARCDVGGASHVPTVVLSDRQQQARSERIDGMDAIEYLVLPFCPLELIARAQAVLHQAQQHPRTKGDPIRRRWFDDGYLSVDFAGARAWVNRMPAHLTRTEFRLLANLVGHAGSVVSHRALLAPVLGADHQDATDCLWVYIRRLREKIEPNPDAPRYVLTEPGAGYRFARPGQARPPWRTAPDGRPVVLRRVPGPGTVVWRVIAGPEPDRSRRCSIPGDRSAAGTEPSSRLRTRRTPRGASLVAVGTSPRS